MGTFQHPKPTISHQSSSTRVSVHQCTFTRPQSLNTQYTNPRQLATLLPTNKHQLPTNQHQLLTMPAPPDTALLQSVTKQHLNQQATKVSQSQLAMKRHQQVTIQEPAMMLALLLTMLPQLPTSQLHRRR